MPQVVLALCCPALGVLHVRALYFSLWLNTCSKTIFSSEYFLSISFLKKLGFSVNCILYVTYHIGNDFLYVSLALGFFFFFLSPVNMWCFLGSCLCPYYEDGNSVLNSLLILVEKLTSRLDLSCNEWSLDDIAFPILTLLNIFSWLHQLRILLFYICCYVDYVWSWWHIKPAMTSAFLNHNSRLTDRAVRKNQILREVGLVLLRYIF